MPGATSISRSAPSPARRLPNEVLLPRCASVRTDRTRAQARNHQRRKVVSRVRIAVVIGVLVVFAVVGVLIIRANQHQGGQNVTFNLTVTGAKTMSPSTLSAHVNDTSTLNIDRK